MNPILDNYLYDDPDTYWFNNGKKSKQSIHGRSYVRYNKSRQQASCPVKGIDEIINTIQEYFKKVGIESIENPVMDPDSIDYLQIKNEFELDYQQDIVWLKFTTDGYLGVVAVSNDINFQIPPSTQDYDLKHTVYNKYTKEYEDKWIYNTSGIIVHKLKKEWDTSFVLVFPLKNIPVGYQRGDIEKAVGNLLIAADIPILDYFSHLY